MPRPIHSHNEKRNTGKVDLIDMNSIREGTEVLSNGEERIQPDFPLLKAVIQGVRQHPDWKQKGWVAADLQIACASIDTKSEGQQRVVDALGRHFSVDASYYRDNFVSAPAGRHPGDIFDRDKGQKSLLSVASRLTYAIGRLSCHSEPQILVVTHCFEVFYPLTHLARTNKLARVGLAYWPSLLDQRWKFTGLFDESEISFFDLDPFVPKIFGGIEIESRRSPSPKPSGLDLI